MSGLALALTLAGAGLMGFANQRGSTCLVAAVAETLRERRWRRITMLAEASLWALAIAILLAEAGAGLPQPAAYPAGAAVIIGGVLLGLGAWLNDACIFGTVARLGTREWHYALTPPGVFLGVLALDHAGLAPAPAALPPAGASLLGAAGWPVAAASIGLILALWLGALRRGEAIATPLRIGTIAIVVCYLAIAALAGPWTYSDTLGRLATGGMVEGGVSLALFGGVLAGALIGGAGGEPAAARFSLRQGLACLAGGALMGGGASLVPGGNDNLLLQGLPALHLHALAALGVMVATIAAAIDLSSAIRQARGARQ